ncbi:hypothetical protein EPO05_00170 [Patescibacteria group bacterium]|nr:MAG: hypothetical protein EPO05_00170 [Patescibacteria group bacterium]
MFNCQSIGERFKELAVLRVNFDTLLDGGKLDEAKDLEREIAEIVWQLQVEAKWWKLPNRYLFEKTIAAIEAETGKRVTDLDEWDKYELIDGKLNGRVNIENHWYPLIGGKAVLQLEGSMIEACEDVRNIDGQLSGRVLLRGDQNWWPIYKGEALIDVDGRRILNCYDVEFINGQLNGVVEISPDHYVPVIDGKVVTTLAFEGEGLLNVRVGGNRFYSPMAQNFDGKMNGSVYLTDRDNGKHLGKFPVLNGKIITQLEGKSIVDCSCIKNINGQLNGLVQFVGSRGAVPVINGKVIDNIDGRSIRAVADRNDFENVGGRLNGSFWVDGEGPLPVINGVIVDQLDGERLSGMQGVRNIAGKPNGTMVRYNIEAILDGKVIQEVDGEYIEYALSLNNIDGTPNGEFIIEREPEVKTLVKVLLGKIVSEVPYDEDA